MEAIFGIGRRVTYTDPENEFAAMRTARISGPDPRNSSSGVPDDPQALVLQILVAVVMSSTSCVDDRVEGVDREVTARRDNPTFRRSMLSESRGPRRPFHAFSERRTWRTQSPRSEIKRHRDETPADDDGVAAGLNSSGVASVATFKLRLDATACVAAAHGAPTT